MYSTVGILSDSPVSGKLLGTHQKLDRLARKLLGKNLPAGVNFPSAKEIVYFEGTRGPDGLKRKSPGNDEPMHFILPDADDGRLIKMISDHHYNLARALRTGDSTRAAFEAAWMAHAITDGLTPAHHVPLTSQTNRLMTNKEFIKVFGVPIKGIMHGQSLLQSARHNWLYWGAGGAMSQHIAFEYGLAMMATLIPNRKLMPRTVRKADFATADFRREFYRSLAEVAKLNMYTRFREHGWSQELAFESRDILFPAVIRAIALGWASAALASRRPEKPNATKIPEKYSHLARQSTQTPSPKPQNHEKNGKIVTKTPKRPKIYPENSKNHQKPSKRLKRAKNAKKSRRQ